MPCSVCSMLKQFSLRSIRFCCVRLNAAHTENKDDIKDNGLDPKAIDNELILNGENGNGTGCVAYALFCSFRFEFRCLWRQRSSQLFGKSVEIRFAKKKKQEKRTSTIEN